MGPSGAIETVVGSTNSELKLSSFKTFGTALSFSNRDRIVFYRTYNLTIPYRTVPFRNRTIPYNRTPYRTPYWHNTD